jgi:hypothetical protein
MVKLFKAETARCIGATRAILYRYFKDDRISVEDDGRIDTTELLKRGYELNTLAETSTGEMRHVDLLSNTYPYERLIETLERERERLARELEAAKAWEETATHEKAALLELLRSQQHLLAVGRQRRVGLWP